MHTGNAAPLSPQTTPGQELSEARFENSSRQDFFLAKLVENNGRLLLAIAVCAALFWTLLYFQFTVDDAYISFRYGHVLAEHHVWNWNPAGARVEAYTSAIYTFLSILPAFAHSFYSLIFQDIRSAMRGSDGVPPVDAITESFCGDPGRATPLSESLVWIHAYSGLETPLYMLLVLGDGALCGRQSDGEPGCTRMRWRCCFQ